MLDLPPLWTALFMALTWGLSLLWAPLNAAWSVMGLFVIGLAIAVSGWAAVTMMRAKTTLMPGRAADALVTSGPFAFSRNPIYLADLGILFGWSLLVGTPLGLVLLWPLQRVLTARFIEPEEASLRAKFGTAFDEYAERVRRWA